MTHHLETTLYCCETLNMVGSVVVYIDKSDKDLVNPDGPKLADQDEKKVWALRPTACSKNLGCPDPKKRHFEQPATLKDITRQKIWVSR